MTEERILNLELAMAEERGLTLPPETQALAGVCGGVEERAATLDRGGPGRHPVGADQEGAAQVGAAVLHRGTVVEVGAASSPHHVCCMSASDVGGKISIIQSTQNTAVFVGRRFGCNERGRSQARRRELGLMRHQLPLPESRASDFPMTHLQASRNTIDSNF